MAYALLLFIDDSVCGFSFHPAYALLLFIADSVCGFSFHPAYALLLFIADSVCGFSFHPAYAPRRVPTFTNLFRLGRRRVQVSRPMA